MRQQFDMGLPPLRNKLHTCFGLLVLLAVLLTCQPSFSQQPGVIPQFSTVETHQYDTINLGTLGIQLNIPIRSKTGHIQFSYRLTGASQITIARTGLWVTTLSSGGFLKGGEAHIAWKTGYTTTTQCYTGQHGLPNGQYESGFYVTDALGNTHPFSFILSGSTSPGQCDYGLFTNGGYATDNSGLYLSVNWNSGAPIYTLTDMDGNAQTMTPPANSFSSMADPNGNTLSATTDTLGQTAMTVSGSYKTPTETFTWTDALGNTQTATLTNSSHIQYAAFGCSTHDLQPGTNYFPTSISFPDGSDMGFTWETNQLNSSEYTGRIASIKLPTGGMISYAYSGGTNGINCADGTPATMTRTTPDGQWIYTHISSISTQFSTTTVTDPTGNNTVYTFELSNAPGLGGQPYEIERQVYSGAITTGTLIETVLTCYNAGSTPTNCNPNAPNYVTTEKDTYTIYPGVAGYSAVKTAYDTYGRVSEVQAFDFNASTPTSQKITQYGSGSPTSQTCTAISARIIDKPCNVTVEDGSGNILSQTWNAYDSNGNLTQTWNLVSGIGSSGVYLSKQYTYDSHGVMQTATDVNGETTNYTTTSCNNMFATSQYPTGFANLATSQTWDCNGGVQTSATDTNGQTISTIFASGTSADPFYRPVQSEDQLGNKTYLAYTPNSTDSSFALNGGASTIESLSTSDSLGRSAVEQLRQGPTSSTWDTKSQTFDSDGRRYETSLACANSPGLACSPSTESQTYDGLNRPLIHIGTGGDVVTKQYIGNDVLTTLTPAPSGENAKATQKEYDGLGRLKSVCVISNTPGSASCGQTNTATGFLTAYTYDAAGRLLSTTENVQVSSPQQVRRYTYDLTGRILTEMNPESGFVHNYYDSVSGTNCTSSSPGDLIERVDANGNTTCYQYDALHRNISIAYAGPNSNGVNKYFVYDAATVNGTSMTYAEGHRAEAYTCSGSCTTKITDEGFSYDQRGSLSAYYQSSPNSGGYYASTATYWEDKSLKTTSGLGLPTLTYGGLDGEGRITTVNALGGNPVSNVTYNNGSSSGEPVGALLAVTLGTGDTQSFTYDTNTGRMTQYAASIGATPVVISGTLTWNPNGTLASNNIVDGYNAADTQNCTYSYDDFIRAASVNCVNGSANVWNQTFGYGTDAFGNLTKSSSGPGVSWTPSYNTTNNQYLTAGSYDANGNLYADPFHTYTWLADGHIASVDSSTITYDALGNKVEENVGGVVQEYVSAFGVSAQMSGQTQETATVALPGGVSALYAGNTLQRFRFPDWQGTVRAESNPATRTFTESLAFAPFGERYAQQGSAYNVDSFTGQPDQLTSDEYDFIAREMHNGQGRWISPDPMSGTGNKYRYADNNPLSKVDLFGLYAVAVNGMEAASVDGSLPGSPSLIESHPQQPTQIDGQNNTETQPTQSSATQQQQPPAQQQSSPAPATENGITSQMADKFKALMTSDSMYSAVNFMAGYSDTITLGATAKINHSLGQDSEIDHSSKLYWGGSATGAVAGGYLGATAVTSIASNLRFLGPSAGYAYANGRGAAVLYGTINLIRFDIHEMQSGAGPVPHVHILSEGGEHGIRFALHFIF